MKIFLMIGALSGFLAVSLGAFAAHALKNRFDDYAQSVWQTANHYHMWHTLAIVLVAVLLKSLDSFWLKFSGASFVAGVIIFSGSLYVLALSGQKWLGAITPIGGVAFLLGWAGLCIFAVKDAL